MRNNLNASRGVTILGSTGHIGAKTLDVIARHPDRFHVVALSGHTQVERLYAQCIDFNPKYAVVSTESAADQLFRRLRAAERDTEVLVGRAGLERIATLPQVECVMAAITGAAGLLPTLEAARAGKTRVAREQRSISQKTFMNIGVRVAKPDGRSEEMLNRYICSSSLSEHRCRHDL